MLPYSNARLFFPVAAVCVAATPCAIAESIITVTDHGAVADSKKDCTDAFRKALAAAKAAKGPVTLVIPPGRYDFFRASATVRDCHTSNSTEKGSPQRHIAIDIQDIDDLTIRGKGVTLMMNGRMSLLVAERCKNLTIEGLEFDSPRPTFSELTAVSKDTESWIAKILPDFTYRIENDNKLLWTVDGSGTGYDQIQRHYENGTVFRNNNDPIGKPTKIEDLGGGKLKFTGGNLANVEPGVTYQFRYARRNEVGMWFNHCKDVVMENVAVRAMHGFGILGQFTENITFRGLTVAPKPGSGRTMASSADVTHFSACKGKILLENCYLSAAHDDAMNVHGTYHRIVAQPAPEKLRVRFMHHQSWGFQPYFPGDEIELTQAGDLKVYESAKVTAVEKVDDYQWDITLDREVSVRKINSDVMENITWTPSVEVVNSDILHMSCRGLLVSTRKPILLQGNRFHRTTMAAIQSVYDGKDWFESGPVKNMTIRGNTFYHCGGTVILLDPHISTFSGHVMENVLIEDNDFFVKNIATSARAVGNLRFSNNRFHIAGDANRSPESLIRQADSQVTIGADNTSSPTSSATLKLANGDFENDSATPQQKIPGWHVTAPATALVKPAGGSRVLYLGRSTAAYQNLGAWDPEKGSAADFKFTQLAGSGNVTASLVLWDGRLAPADSTSPAKLKILTTRTFEAAAAKTERKLTADISSIMPGSRVWLVLAATKTTAAVDNVVFSLTRAGS